MDDVAEQRLAHNESVFRELNESIESGHWPGEEDAPVAFRCECAQLGCSVLLELPARDYERIRTNPRQFIVATDHHQPEVEIVAEAFENYLVVEKRGEAGKSAEASDPRG